LLGPGGGRPAPASFLNACFRCLGVPDLLTAAHDASAGASSDDKSDIISDDVINEGSSLNEIDWRLAEALMKLCSELAKNLKSTILKSSAGYCSAVVELLSTLGRPGLAVDLLAVLAHEQASVRACKIPLLARMKPSNTSEIEGSEYYWVTVAIADIIRNLFKIVAYFSLALSLFLFVASIGSSFSCQCDQCSR
jgi:hypothetical protein